MVALAKEGYDGRAACGHTPGLPPSRRPRLGGIQ